MKSPIIRPGQGRPYGGNAWPDLVRFTQTASDDARLDVLAGSLAFVLMGGEIEHG